MFRYNDHVHFPLLSVFKFHLALTVLDKMDKQGISLDSIVFIKASQMLLNTCSPLCWVSAPSTYRKQKTTCTPAARLYTVTGVLLFFPMVGNTTLPSSSWIHTRLTGTQASSPAYHAWYIMRCERQGSYQQQLL